MNKVVICRTLRNHHYPLNKIKTTFKNAWPYQYDAMNLPVADVDAAVHFYESVMGFKVESRMNEPHKSAVLARDGIRIGLAENGLPPPRQPKRPPPLLRQEKF
jgi:catechol 2,3-dioxygenase-like lactoylglutathione lyase family enzyme